MLWHADLALASWTRRGYDAVARDAAAIAGRLLGGLAAGDVLLLHDGATARAGGGNPVVLEVLPRVLAALAERHLRAVPMALDRCGAEGAPALPEPVS